MTTILGLSCALLAAAAFLAACRMGGWENGYNEGHKDGTAEGFEAGRLDAVEWWAKSELAVQKVREEIWKEEA